MYVASTVVHELPAWLDVGAMVVAAAFGAHVARLRRIALSGVLLEGVLGGLGGGITREGRTLEWATCGMVS
jgi:uncharacterized membrane protein YeiH